MFPWKYLHNKVNAAFKKFPTEEDYRQTAKSENNLIFASLAVECIIKEEVKQFISIVIGCARTL